MTTEASSCLLRALDRAVSAQGPSQQPRLIGDDGAYSLAQVSAQAEALARVLAQRGVRPGDRVAHLGKNSAGLIILLFACARLGALLMPMNWRLNAKEWAWMVADAAPKLMLATTDFEAQAEGLCGSSAHALSDLLTQASELKATAAGEAAAVTEAVTEAGTAAEASKDQDDLLLVYTSGSTGRPKGAIHTQAAVWANAQLSEAMHGFNAAGQQDRVLTILPMFHVGGLAIQTLAALLFGAQVRVMTAFEPQQMAALHREYRPTLTLHVPATLQAMLSLPDWNDLDLSDLRAVSIGSTDVPLALITALQSRGIPVLQIYGATESGPISIFQTIDLALARPGSIGKAPPGVDIELRRADGGLCALDEPGEIMIRADNLARRYWPDLPLTDAKGFWASGDVAAVDTEGVYWFRDRLKNVIISGGENIYPAEIERVLRSIPGVKDCCVIGEASDRWGQSPVAVIEGEVQPLDIFENRLKEELARFKHPSRIEFTAALPRNAMGKVVRERVAQTLKTPTNPIQ